MSAPTDAYYRLAELCECGNSDAAQLIADGVTQAVEAEKNRADKAEVAFAKSELDCLREIRERDYRTGIIEKLCDAAGHRFCFDFEWTSQYGFEDAVRDVSDKIDALRAQLAASQAREQEAASSRPVAPVIGDPVIAVLAREHLGMKYSAEGAIHQAGSILKRQGPHGSGIGFVLGEMLGHLNELAARYYTGDPSAVDEFCQLYCLGETERKAALAAQKAQPSPFIAAQETHGFGTAE